jgi:hypothetical protein
MTVHITYNIASDIGIHRVARHRICSVDPSPFMANYEVCIA